MIKRISDFMKKLGTGKKAICCCKKTSPLIKSSNIASSNDQKTLDEIVKNLKHVAIIADGNRRWARQRGLSPLEGHHKGFIEVAPRVCEELWNMGIHTVTIWCLSTGNWNRDKDEIGNLLSSAEMLIKIMVPIAKSAKGRVIHLGKKDRLPSSLLNTIKEAEGETAMFSEHVFNIGIDYSGIDEVVRACQKILAQGVAAELLTDKLLEKTLDTANQPYPTPDLVIRSAGEQRLSGFMMWQTIYSELYFTETYFPEFNMALLEDALFDFGRRKRTFSQ